MDMLSYDYVEMTYWLHNVVLNLFQLEKVVPPINMLYVTFHVY